MAGRLALGVFVFAITVGSSARAAGRDPAAAEALFQEGRKALEQGNLPVACAKFGESQRLDPGVGTLMNWADCEEKLGRLASAWERWHEAVEQLPPSDDRLSYARKRAAALEPRVPRLSIQLVDVPEGADARVFRDDVELGTASLGSALPVEAGSHTVRVVARGHADREVTVALAEGQRQSIEVGPGPAIATATAGTSVDVASGPPRSSRKTWGFVALGAGAAGLVGATVTGLMIQHDHSVVGAHCDANKICDDDGYSAARSGHDLLVPNLALWAVGIVGAGAGAYLLISHGHSSSAAVGARAVPGGGLLACEGRF